jgi:hypothetical protein
MRLISFFAVALFITTVSCDNDLDVNAEWEEIIVVYGLLDKGDSVHYLRINKAFLPENEDAREVAGRPDSVYFDEGEISVTIDEWRSGTKVRSYNFFMVTRDDKEPGIFPYPDHILYRNNEEFYPDPAAEYVLNIESQKGNGVSAVTRVLDDGNLSNPALLPHGRRELRYFNEHVNFTVQPGRNAIFYDLELKFVYKEFPAGEPAQADTNEIIWSVYNLRRTTGGEVRYSDSWDQFFNFLRGNIPADPSLERRALYVELIPYGGGDELYNYIMVNRPSSSIVQKEPEYTNIESGYGIFSSRRVQNYHLHLHSTFIDSLVNGTQVPDRNFIY